VLLLITWWPNLLSGNGSTWFPDSTGPPELTLYPVSGIYGFSLDRWYWADVGWVPASPVQGEPGTNYRGDFRGTSFATPQVAALAALLRNARPSASYSTVANRIVSTRNQAIEQTMINTYSVPMAGLVDFNAALAGW
jgi:subtilisin family serine protease